MSQQQRPNSGILGVNSRKTQPNHPDFTGRIRLSPELIQSMAKQMAAGQDPEIEISGWKKAGQGGGFISISAKEKWVRPEGQATAPASRQAPPAQTPWSDDDDSPF
jgi:hypothetical protein